MKTVPWRGEAKSRSSRLADNGDSWIPRRICEACFVTLQGRVSLRVQIQ